MTTTADRTIKEVERYEVTVSTEAGKTLLNEDQCKARYPDAQIFLPPSLKSPEKYLKHFRTLSAFAHAVKKIDFGLYKANALKVNDRLLRKHLQFHERALYFELLGTGQLGLAFKVTGIQAAPAVLKVFYPRHADHVNFSGPFSETALGLFITAQGVSNMPHLILGCPSEGWQLTELISTEYQSPTPDGPRWQDLGLRPLDLKKRDGNFIRLPSGANVRVDYGHLTSEDRTRCTLSDEVLRELPSRGEYISKKRFVSLLERFPHERTKLFGMLRCIEANERLDAIKSFYNFVEMEAFPVQEYLIMGLIPCSAIAPLYQFLREHHSPLVRGRAVFNLAHLPLERRRAILRDWSHSPDFLELRVGLGKSDAFAEWMSRNELVASD